MLSDTLGSNALLAALFAPSFLKEIGAPAEAIRWSVEKERKAVRELLSEERKVVIEHDSITISEQLGTKLPSVAQVNRGCFLQDKGGNTSPYGFYDEADIKLAIINNDFDIVEDANIYSALQAYKDLQEAEEDIPAEMEEYFQPLLSSTPQRKTKAELKAEDKQFLAWLLK